MLAAMAMATVLGMPAAAGALGNAEDAATPAPASGQATAGAEPQPVGTDDASADDATGGVEVMRYVGADPYEQSLKIARALVDAGDGSSEWVVLTSGGAWADAVAAGPLAASLGAPVVLVPPGGLQSPTARPDLVEFLRSTRARRAVIVGSPDVLPNHEPSVLFGLGMLPRNIERVHGDDPVATSVAVAERMGTPAEFGEQGRTVIVASDRSAADAAALGPLAAAGPFPLLLTAPRALDPRIAAYLAEHEIAHVVLVGGTAAVAPAVQEAIKTTGAAVTRLAGRDRSDTARLATLLLEQQAADEPACTDSLTRIGLASAQHPEQALTAGSLLAHTCTPLRYTDLDQLPTDLRNTLYLARDPSPGARVTVFGDDYLIPASILDAEMPPARIAAFNFRPNTDRNALIGILEIIDDAGVRRTFPDARLTRLLDAELPPDWRREAQYGYEFTVDYWSHVSWSHDGEWLAYRGIDGESLFVLNATSGELRRVDPTGHRVDADAIGFAFRWSPVANKLAFSAVVEEESALSDPDLTVNGVSEFTRELYLYDTESDESVRLTDNNVQDSVGPWSPNGSRLALTQTPATATWSGWFGNEVAFRRLSVVEIATGELVTWHNDYVLHVAGERPDRSGFESVALWSPDGNSLAFSAMPGGDRLAAAPHIHVAMLNDDVPVSLGRPDYDACEDSNWYMEPHIRLDGWQPSGASIAYSASLALDRWALTQSIEGGNAVEVLRLRSSCAERSGVDDDGHYIGWMPDGKTLLYQRTRCHYLDGYSAAETVAIEAAPGSSHSSVVLEIPSRIGNRHASCSQVILLAPNGHGIALHDNRLGLRVARFSDGIWKTLLSPTQRPPQSAFDTYNCHREWTIDGIHIGCAGSAGEF